MRLKQLCPPEVFGCIEPQLYRSNSLGSINFPFIASLGIYLFKRSRYFTKFTKTNSDV